MNATYMNTESKKARKQGNTMVKDKKTKQRKQHKAIRTKHSRTEQSVNKKETNKDTHQRRKEM